MKFFEEYSLGERVEIGSHTFTAADIKRFAAAFDPQPFHMDEAKAVASHFGGLIASGWHSQAVWMKLNVRAWQKLQAERLAAALPLAAIGPSPGFDRLQWLRPIFAGDTVTFVNEVIATKPSRSKPQWGLVSFKAVGRNQAGEEVIAFIGHVFVERQDKTAVEEKERSNEA